jgi:hypothetical protein
MAPELTLPEETATIAKRFGRNVLHRERIPRPDVTGIGLGSP